MELEVILTAISTVGFPIACVVVMFWFLNKEREDHKTEMSELRDVIAQNNVVLEGLKQLIQDKL